jgi:hypothetical protein
MTENLSDTNSAGDQAQTSLRPSTNPAGDDDRNFKQELCRNKQFRLRKSDKRRRAETIATSCPL